MSYLLRFKRNKKEIIWTFIIVCGIVCLSAFMFLYNRYIIYVKNMEASQINLTNHLNYTYKDKFYGNIDVDYDINSNTYIGTVDFYIPNETYTFNLSSRGYIIGDGYLHNNKDNLMSQRFARQLKESLEQDLKSEFPEIFKIYTEMQVLKGKYDHKAFYNKNIDEPHIVHIYLNTKFIMSKKRFDEIVKNIKNVLIESGYTNLNNVHVNYMVRKEAPARYYSPIDFSN